MLGHPRSNWLSNTAKMLHVLGLAAALAGCGASATYQPLSGDDAARPSREARAVEVRSTAPNGRQYREVGILSASASTVEDVTEREFVRALREKAATKGCDALIVSDGTPHAGSLATLDTDKPGRRGVCIVYSDGKGPDSEAVAESNRWLDGNAPREHAVTLSAEAPPSSCTSVGVIRTDLDHPSESVRRALFRRRAREKKANYVLLQPESFTAGEHGGEAAAYACPAGATNVATASKDG